MKLKYYRAYLAFAIYFLAATACEKTETEPEPTVLTRHFAIDSTLIVVNLFASITKTGKSIDNYGFCLSQKAFPSVNDTIFNFGNINDTTTFTANLKPIPYQTSIYYRAFVTNGENTFYGFTQSFCLFENILFHENFETQTNFSTSFKNWQNIDSDSLQTYGIGDISYAGKSKPAAFIVFNPYATSPSLSKNEEWQAHDGDKFAACFSAVNAANDNWLISKPIQLQTKYSEFKLSLWAKSANLNFGREQFMLGISNDSIISNFKFIENSPFEAPSYWKSFIFDISQHAGTTIYVAIRMVSENSYCLMLDDIIISAE